MTAMLPRFAVRVPDNGDPEPELPFCVSPSAWVQVIRALTPRTDDFNRTVVDLLTSPFVGYRPAVNPFVVQEVVGRMDHFHDASPEIALAVLTDTAKVTEIERAVAAEDEEIMEEAVRSAYSAKAREMEEAIAASEARVAKAHEALAASEDARAEAELRVTPSRSRARARDREAAEQKHRDDQSVGSPRPRDYTTDWLDWLTPIITCRATKQQDYTTNWKSRNDLRGARLDPGAKSVDHFGGCDMPSYSRSWCSPASGDGRHAVGGRRLMRSRAFGYSYRPASARTVAGHELGALVS